MSANIPLPRGYSRAAGLAFFGPEVMAEIDALVASAPEPSAAELDSLRLIFAPVVQRCAESAPVREAA